MKLFKNVDERLKEIGFVKQLVAPNQSESEYGARYRRWIREYGGYAQRLDILHKENGKHLIQSYQECVNSDGLNNVVGLTYEETKLAMKKYGQLKRKYKWK